MRYLLFVFLVLFSLNIFAADIQAELSVVSAPSVLREGDLVQALVKVWPIESADLNEFRQLENMVLANALFVTDIESIEVSLNNADVVEIKLLAIAKPTKENLSSQFVYKGQTIQISTPALHVESSGNAPEDYYIMDQGLLRSSLYSTLLISGLLIMALMAFWKRNNLKSLLRKFRRDPVAVARKKYNEVFLKASTRKDYEEIYALRKDWMNLIKDHAPAYREFFQSMEQHQYKRLWTSEETNEVKNHFEIIRRSFV
ncbi:MAG: hypothetical protein WC635_08355 [Bacteriovorax sp.]|jgi:hypothetical protein